MDQWGAIGTIVASIIGFVGIWIGLRATRAEKRIDRDVARQDEQFGRQATEIERLTVRVEELERKDRIKDNYIGELRAAIYREEKPPPPPWPKELIA